MSALFVLLTLVEPQIDVRAEFDRAVKYLNASDYENALPILEALFKEVPNDPSVVWNLGTTAIYLEKYELSKTVWKQMESLEPNNWEILAKLIQTYQGLNDKEKRDSIRARLLKQFAETSNTDLKNREKYCIEQFPFQGGRVYFFEFFDPFSVDLVKFYEAVVVDPDNKRRHWVSVGSYEMTNSISLETGGHQTDERMYHFDAYYPTGSHRTLGFFVSKMPPTYDDFRPKAIQFLEKLESLPPI